jgi:hypothetical protein
MLRASLFRSHCAALIVAGAASGALPAQAQQNTCQQAQTLLGERQALGQQFTKTLTKDKKIDPRAACPVLTKLVANGENTMQWLEGNKDWCQIPDQFAQGLQADHDKVKSLRGQACQAAAKIAQMEKQAKQAQQNGGGGGLLGGNSLTGEYKIPRGAL